LRGEKKQKLSGRCEDEADGVKEGGERWRKQDDHWTWDGMMGDEGMVG
jgi:hypothetical protein